MASTSSQISSTLASYSTSTNWDVFLSFRGEDTRYTFISHLYSALDRHGIRTFMDDPELRSGEVISDALLQAIKESRTYIVVLSENYASSSWCLDELVEILNCHKTMQRLVIPVFYNIDPSIVRHQSGSFKRAFEKHKFRFAGDMERVENWLLTLREVADKSGKHVYGKRSEADFINDIIDEVLLEINPTALYVAKYPVGLDSRVKDITTLFSSETKGVIKIGIYGMGGVGKTTLAKAVFNQFLLGNFKGSCFLANVREISGTLKGLESLQQQLITNVLKGKNKVEVDSVDQGTKLIGARICSSKILVVIDDLDDQKQFESLVGPFASGSVVIITTRDEEILDKIEVETKYRYRVNELDNVESLVLFSKHAFGDSEPDNSLMVLCKDILCHAQGLPLALEVFGSYLYKRSEVGWKSYIEKLQRIPNSSIQQSLIISLDALELDDPILKKMFLDIACFFIGREKEHVVKIMETYYSYADNNIDILRKKCLLTINRDVLQMHDLLQDMGREISRNNSPDEPGKHSRLWVSKDICDVLKKHKGTEAIEGIMLHNLDYKNPFKEVSFSMETFRRMGKLRFLFLKNINLTGKFEQTLEDLRWFCWARCPLKCLPYDFCPQKLVMLEFPKSKLRTLWKVSPVLEYLKTLNMPFSEDLTKTPDFSKLLCLETLNFSGCKSLEKVHISIGSLERLVILDLDNCVKLRSLPDTSCNLRALKILRIDNCEGLEALPEKLGNMESLIKINACGLNVSKLPDSIGCLSKLVKLKLDLNRKLETLPNTICSLRALEALSINHCTNVKELPVKLGDIESLRELNVEGLTISKLPDSIGSLSKLVELYVCNNKKLETLPDTIGELRSLEILSIAGCEKLEILPDQVWKLTRLRELSASWATMLKKLPDIRSGQIALSLQDLILSATGITALPSGFSQLSNLRSLQLFRCRHLLSIPKLSPSIKLINASGCKSLERLPNVSNLEQLEILKLAGCIGLTEILGLEKLTALKELHLANCSEMFPEWVSQSGEDQTTRSLHLPRNASHDYLGMIACFKRREDWYSLGGLDYSVETSAVTNSDTKIEIKSYGLADVVGIHLLLKPEVTMTDEYNSSTVNELKLVDPSLQDIFLDIACFFIGWKNEEVVKIMETCYTSVNHKFDILKEKCLLTINDRDELEMHHELQHIGRNIARNNSPSEPGNHSRLWLSVNIYDVLKKYKGTKAIEGIIPRKLKYEDALEGESFSTETFKRMSKLRFLYLKNAKLTGSFEQTLEDLRWFCWDGCPLECLPSEFHPQKLVILELPHSQLRKMWEPNMVSHVFDKLKTLNMSYSLALTTTPDFTKLPFLETLNFGYCKSLEEVHISVGGLVMLSSLNLHDCVNLETLPDTICNLKMLRCLDIRGCSSLEALPMELGNFESLTELEACGLSDSKLLNLSNLKQLEELHLSFCSGLTEIQGLEELTSIGGLYLEGCKSFLAYTFTKRLFQTYSGLRHHIDISAPEFPGWIGELYYGSEMSLKLPLNASYNLLGMVLCFECPKNCARGTIYYNVKNTTSGFLWRGFFNKNYYKSLMVIVPISIFPIKDGEEIEFESQYAIKCKIYLLYKSEYDSATVRVEDERSNTADSELERNKKWLTLGSTIVNAEESDYPSKRLKHLECDNNWLSLSLESSES
ncbi:hypothetical protein AgCh_039931 [Apium graveolens]